MRGALLGLLAGLLVAGGSHALLSGMDRSSERDRESEGELPRVAASTATFKSLVGETHSLAEFEGRVVILNIWGTWCPPCIREIPHLVEVHRAIDPQGGVVVGLAVDSGSPEDIHAFWRDRLDLEPSYPIWLGTNREARAHFDAFGLPNTLVIDRDGMIRERFLGLVTEETLLDAVEPLL